MLARGADVATAITRVVDEELLIQRGLELDLARQHNGARSTLLQAVTQVVVAENLGVEPTEDELRGYFETNPGRFSSPDALQVERILFSGHEHGREEARLRSARAYQQLLQGEAFAIVRARLGDEDLVLMPEVALIPRQLNQHIGPSLLRAAMGLADGQISKPVEVGQNLYVLRVVRRIDGAPLAYDDVRKRVVSEYRRELDRASLRAYLEWLRARADIRYTELADSDEVAQ
ncbi:MAG: peptidylprolyl isomerase [Pseudomonadales bacterium]|jgi:peptidyl-prolyl cis-trans isomerase C|nr:peptidylprolyl isomerase [Pseudomonadales bacterium]MDP6470573.1 peptidylprolyl isomerase [Pseudomonadales bacterium]MDP6828572.1 peptidylprolyl isomerase [Pseudomonadales bacterium]MDP6971862.1 peptidylprolyl isomerase [Pseudomonadales bacterium]